MDSNPALRLVVMAMAITAALAVAVAVSGIGVLAAQPFGPDHTGRFAPNPVSILSLGPALDLQSRQNARSVLRLAQAAPSNQNEQGSSMSEEELMFRLWLLERSTQFGGIFRPMIDSMGSGSSEGYGGSSAGSDCAHYTDYAACQAYKAGDLWSADRLQRKEATPAERDWYNR